jgi:hypothetical protein
MAHFIYDSVSEFVAVTKGKAANKANAGKGKVSGYAGWLCSDRTDVDNFEQAMDVLPAPFPAGVARVEKLRAQLDVPAPTSIRRRLTRGPEGDSLDMGRVWNGELDRAWSRARRMSSVGPRRIELRVVNICTGGESANAVAWRGVAALALSDALEGAGYSVAIVSEARGKDCNGDKHDVDVTIKNTGEQTSVHDLASVLCSTMFFRAGYHLHVVKASAKPVGHYSVGVEYSRCGQTKTAGFDYTGTVTSEVNDKKTAAAWVATHLAAITGQGAE